MVCSPYRLKLSTISENRPAYLQLLHPTIALDSSMGKLVPSQTNVQECKKKNFQKWFKCSSSFKC